MIRSLEPELMDSPDIHGPILEKFHRDLERVHFLLGSYPTLARFIKNDPQPVRHVIDIGCGGGALLAYLRDKLGVTVTGIDPKPGHSETVKILAADAITEPLPEADVAVCSFVAHHLTPEQNIALIRNVSRSCKRFLILDLIRHPMPLWLFSIFICPLIGHEAAVDGRQSVRRSYTPPEFRDMVDTAIKGTAATYTVDVPPLLSRQIIDIRFNR